MATSLSYRALCKAVDVDGFDTALFSALEQSHCAPVACQAKWVTVAFYITFEISTQVVYLQRF